MATARGETGNWVYGTVGDCNYNVKNGNTVNLKGQKLWNVLKNKKEREWGWI